MIYQIENPLNQLLDSLYLYSAKQDGQHMLVKIGYCEAFYLLTKNNEISKWSMNNKSANQLHGKLLIDIGEAIDNNIIFTLSE